jgi:hypothetical protein
MANWPSRSELEELAKGISWKDILEPCSFTGVQVDTLADSTPVISWQFDDGELNLVIQTYGENDPAMILDINHLGNFRLSKFDALKKFRCGDNWVYAKALILEGVSQGGSTLDKIGRKLWGSSQHSNADLTPTAKYIDDPLFQSLVDTEYVSLTSRDLARSKFEEMQFALEGEPVPAISLNELLSKLIEESKWVIDGLLIVGGTAFLAAKAKAGKTTMCIALLKCLADGGMFLGKFKVEPPAGRIGYMNLELTDAQMQEWVSREDIANTERIHIWNLRGKPNPFRSEASRSKLIIEIQKLGIKTLIIDTFAKVFPGEANNNSEVNKFLIMLDETLDKAGIENLIMLVHAGNDAKKIRGATALTDHPDAIWYLFNDEDKNRFFSAVGRDVEVAEGQIFYDTSTHQLEYTGAGKKATKDSSAKELMLNFIKSNSGENASVIDECIGGTKSFKIRLRRQLIKEGLVFVQKGPSNSDLYFAA